MSQIAFGDAPQRFACGVRTPGVLATPCVSSSAGTWAIEALAAGGAITMAAADEMVRLGQANTPRHAENRVRHAATMILREVDAG